MRDMWPLDWNKSHRGLFPPVGVSFWASVTQTVTVSVCEEGGDHRVTRVKTKTDPVAPTWRCSELSLDWGAICGEWQERGVSGVSTWPAPVTPPEWRSNARVAVAVLSSVSHKPASFITNDRGAKLSLTQNTPTGRTRFSTKLFQLQFIRKLWVFMIKTKTLSFSIPLCSVWN